MTNLQNGAPRLSATVLRRIWLWAPIAAGVGLSAALILLVLMPLWVALQRDSERLQEVEALISRLPEERSRSQRLLVQEERAVRQQRSLIRLISGNGDVSTFQAKLDQLAKANAVQLDLFEPRATGSLPANKPGRTNGEGAPRPAKPPADALAAEGLESHVIVMAAQGTFPALLAFLRELEALNILVAQSDLQLNKQLKKDTDKLNLGGESVVMRMAMKLYSMKSSRSDANPSGRVPGQNPGNPPETGAASPALPPN